MPPTLHTRPRRPPPGTGYRPPRWPPQTSRPPHWRLRAPAAAMRASMRRTSNCRNSSGRPAARFPAASTAPSRHLEILLHQMLHQVHHEQRIAVRAGVDKRGQGAATACPAAQPHTPPPPRQGGTPGGGPRHALAHTAPAPCRAGDAPQQRLHRAIRPQHQQRAGSRRHGAQALYGGDVASRCKSSSTSTSGLSAVSAEGLGTLPQPGAGWCPLHWRCSCSISVSLTSPGSCVSHMGAYRSTARSSPPRWPAAQLPQRV